MKSYLRHNGHQIVNLTCKILFCVPITSLLQWIVTLNVAYNFELSVTLFSDMFWYSLKYPAGRSVEYLLFTKNNDSELRGNLSNNGDSRKKKKKNIWLVNENRRTVRRHQRYDRLKTLGWIPVESSLTGLCGPGRTFVVDSLANAITVAVTGAHEGTGGGEQTYRWYVRMSRGKFARIRLRRRYWPGPAAGRGLMNVHLNTRDHWYWPRVVIFVQNDATGLGVVWRRDKTSRLVVFSAAQKSSRLEPKRTPPWRRIV